MAQHEDGVQLYQTLGNYWKRDKLFLWKTHSLFAPKAQSTPNNRVTSTKSFEESLEMLRNLNNSNDKTSAKQSNTTSHSGQDAISKQESGTAESLTLFVSDEKNESPNITFEAVDYHCPLCDTTFISTCLFGRHLKLVHFLFSWDITAENVLHGYHVNTQVDMVQMVEHVDSQWQVFWNIISLAPFPEPCTLQPIYSFEELCRWDGQVEIYLSSMKFGTNGKAMWKRCRQEMKKRLGKLQSATKTVSDASMRITSLQDSTNASDSPEQIIKQTDMAATKETKPLETSRSNSQLSEERPRKRKKSKSSMRKSFSEPVLATLNDRTYYHTVTLHPIHPDEMDQDSESDYSEDWKDELDDNVMNSIIDSSRTKAFLQLWNHFIRKSHIIADFEIPLACERFVQECAPVIGKEKLYHPFRMHLLNLFEHGLLQKKDIVHCCQLLTHKMQSEST